MRDADQVLDDLLWIDDTHFRVHSRAYTDPAVFDLEMERVFGRAWVFLGHVSEIARPGDYKTGYIGTQPVIVTRDQAGQVHVLYNRCVHRGSVVCRMARGNSNFFRCPYHGWTYANDGRLVGVTMRDGYGKSFEAPEGLLKVPRVEVYRGLIFACAADDGPTFDEFLSDEWRLGIDRKLNQSPVGEIRVVSAPYVVVYQGNWKFQTENMIDGYHFFFVHEPLVKLQQKYGDTTGDYGAHQGHERSTMREIRLTGRVSDEELDRRLAGQYGEDVAEYLRAQIERYGRDEVAVMEATRGLIVYPSLGVIHHQLRSIRPISVNRTEVTIYPYELVGAPDSYNEGWLRSQERFYGPSGHGMPDDVEMFALNQQGLAVKGVDWLILERGYEREQSVEAASTPAKIGDEARIRSQWRLWRKYMLETSTRSVEGR